MDLGRQELCHGNVRVAIGYHLGSRGIVRRWVFRNQRPLGSRFSQSCTTLGLPRVPLPFLEMSESVYPKQGDGAVIFVPVVRVKVDSNIPIEVA